jgi:hypothetical protein
VTVPPIGTVLGLTLMLAALAVTRVENVIATLRMTAPTAAFRRIFLSSERSSTAGAA